MRRLARDLEDTARSFPRTVGIAAPAGRRALAGGLRSTAPGHPKVPDALGPIWLVNPVLVEQEGDEVGREGCLSLPDMTANVRRAERIVVEADRPRRRAAGAIRTSGFEARVILHEMDHLDGILILDRVASLALDVFPRRSR